MMTLLNKQKLCCAFGKTIAAAIVIYTTCTGVVSAEGWKGDVEGGTVVNNSGNQTRLRFSLTNDTRPFTHNLFAEWLRGNEGSDGYAIGYNPRYWLGDQYYAFGESRLRTDEAFDIEREIRALVGVGGQFLDSEAQGLFAEIGLGSRQTEFESAVELTQGFGIARLGYFQILSELVKIDLNLSGLLGEDEVADYFGEIGLSLRVATGSIRYAYRSRSYKIGDEDAETVNDSFLSFNYGF